MNEINNEIEMEAEGIVSIQRKIDQLKIENIESDAKRAEVMRRFEVYFKEFTFFFKKNSLKSVNAMIK